MFGADKRYLSISINEGVIKVVQATSAGVLEKVARASFTPTANGDDAVRTLKSLLVSFNRKSVVVCTIPANAATAKNIEVPSTDPEEIKSIINLQASHHTPYSKEEVLISFMNLGVNAANNTRLLLVIVHRDMVKERISVLEKAGLNADKIIFVPEAQARFYSKALNFKKETPACGVVDFSLNTTSYMVINKGALVFVRSIPVGIKNFMESPEGVGKLQEELKKSIDSFTQEDGSDVPNAYVVTTDLEAVHHILPALKENLNSEFIPNPFVNFIKGPRALRQKLQSDFGDDSFLDVIACAVMAAKCEVNLMPEEMVLKKTVERQSREATKAGVAAVFIMVLIGAMIMSNIYFRDAFLNKNLRAEFAPQRIQAQELQERMNKAKVVRSYIKDRMVTLDVIHELYAMTPHTIYLNSVMMDEDGTVTIDGISDSMSQVFSYVKALDDSAMFQEAKTKSTATKKDNGKDVATFEIEFKVINLKEPA